MKQFSHRAALLLAICTGALTLPGAPTAVRAAESLTASPVAHPLTVTAHDGRAAHLYPTAKVDAARRVGAQQRSLSNVTYHGGRIMRSVRIYTIFWAPAKLQNGGATSIPASYKLVLNHMVQNYAGHAIANINTQYYEIVSGTTFYHTGLGGFGGTATDTSPYPASGCTDSFTPGNCLTDTQIQTKIQNVMTANGWKGGFGNIFLLFTSSGEGSCFTSASTSCAYTDYCAYHSWFGSSSAPVIYANQPYGNNSVCQVTTQLPNPGTSDSAATAARHEISEATSDPQLNAWWDSASQEETSDKCNFNYGTRTWDFVSPNFLANYMWGGYFFLLQQEYDNHANNCVQQGP